MRNIVTMCFILYMFFIFAVVIQLIYTTRGSKTEKTNKNSKLQGISVIHDNMQNKRGLKSSKLHKTRSDLKHKNVDIDAKASKYFYGHNITDTRKDYNGASFYPKLKYHIGVLSTEKFLNTRSDDLYHTWGKEAKSIAFYVGELKKSYDGHLPVTSLKDVNDTLYPPQMKSFMMIKHWCDNLIHKYDWFVKVDDDTYVKVTPLEDFLWSLDETQKYYVGRPGRGLKHEKHKLGLNGNTFCTGPTVIYSKPLLQKLCPHLDSCMSNVLTPHEDTEIGRCVMKNLNMQCADNKDDIHLSQKLKRNFFQTYAPTVFMGDLANSTIIRNSITLHEVKHSIDMYNLHHYYRLWTSEDKYPRSQHKSNRWKIIHKPPTAGKKEEVNV